MGVVSKEMKKSGMIIVGVVFLAMVWTSVTMIVRAAEGGSMRIGLGAARRVMEGGALMALGVSFLVATLLMAWSSFKNK